MKIPIIKINQNENIFFIGKIKVRDLANIATNKIRKSYDKRKLKGYFNEIDDKITQEIHQGKIWYLKDLLTDPNIQREQSKKRIKEIAEYLEKENTVFPNSIIINLSSVSPDKESSDVIKVKRNYIEFNESDVVAMVIDGQHRLAGFNYVSNMMKKENLMDSFEVIVTIFIGLEVPQQAELFATINGKQKPVNKSILYDLSELTENEYTELMTTHLIVKWFNVDESSPWFAKIKMLGTGEGNISQSAFIDGLLPLLEDINLRKQSGKPVPIFRSLFLRQEEEEIIAILYNYFKAFKEVFPNAWGDKKYILTKTTGLGAMLKLLPYFYYYLHSSNSEYKKEKYVNLIYKIKGFDFSSKKYTGGGKALQKGLSEVLKKKIFENIDLDHFEKKYREEFAEDTSGFKLKLSRKSR